MDLGRSLRPDLHEYDVHPGRLVPGSGHYGRGGQHHDGHAHPGYLDDERKCAGRPRSFPSCRLGRVPPRLPPYQFTVTFSSTSVSGVGTVGSDFIIQTTGTAAGTYSGVSGSGAVYTVTVNGVSGDGTLGLYVNDNDDIKAGTIPLGGTGKTNNAGSGSFAGQTTYTINNTAPSVSHRRSLRHPIRPAGNSVSYTVTYADPNFNTSTLASGKPHAE